MDECINGKSEHIACAILIQGEYLLVVAAQTKARVKNKHKRFGNVHGIYTRRGSWTIKEKQQNDVDHG